MVKSIEEKFSIERYTFSFFSVSFIRLRICRLGKMSCSNVFIRFSCIFLSLLVSLSLSWSQLCSLSYLSRKYINVHGFFIIMRFYFCFSLLFSLSIGWSMTSLKSKQPHFQMSEWMNENLKEKKTTLQDLQITPNLYAASCVGIVFGDLNNVYIYLRFSISCCHGTMQISAIGWQNGKTNMYFINIFRIITIMSHIYFNDLLVEQDKRQRGNKKIYNIVHNQNKNLTRKAWN